MDKYLIINADDFGMCHSANMAVEQLFKCGGITSSTIMAPCAWAGEAVNFAKNNPQFAVGVHLTTTSEWKHYRWMPVGRGGKSLVDGEGYMHHESDEFEKAADLADVDAEIRAQIEHLKGLGLEPSHLDNHMGSLYGIETGRFGSCFPPALEFLSARNLVFLLIGVCSLSTKTNSMSFGFASGLLNTTNEMPSKPAIKINNHTKRTARG